MFVPTDQHRDVSSLSDAGKILYAVRNEVLLHWKTRVRAEIEAARELDEPILINSIPLFLDNLCQALSPGLPRTNAAEGTTVGFAHGNARARNSNYYLTQLTREYQILRDVLFELLSVHTTLNRADSQILYASLDEALRQAVAAYVEVQNSVQDMFVATLTHDLRTPLSAARMATELIERQSSPDEIAELARQAIGNIDRVNIMIQDLLDATKVKSGGRLHLRLTRFDLGDMVHDVVTRMSAQHGARFLVETRPSWGCWDKPYLERTLENLLTNAVKYGDPNAPIQISLRPHHQNVSISVHNEGPPIPVHEHLHVFEAFRRGRTDPRSPQQGWGLGLALVRSVAYAHGGSVELDSAPGRGTTFTIDLPVDTRTC